MVAETADPEVDAVESAVGSAEVDVAGDPVNYAIPGPIKKL